MTAVDLHPTLPPFLVCTLSDPFPRSLLGYCECVPIVRGGALPCLLPPFYEQRCTTGATLCIVRLAQTEPAAWDYSVLRSTIERMHLGQRLLCDLGHMGAIGVSGADLVLTQG